MGKRAVMVAIALAAATAGAAVADDRVTLHEEPAASRPVLETPLSAGIPVGSAHVPDPAPALLAGADDTASALGATEKPAGTLAELSSARAASSQAVRVAAVPPQGRERPRLSTAGPAPADPWALLCALAVVAYIALRKLRAVSAAGWSERITPGNHL